MLPAFSVTPAPLAPPSATPISCEPCEPASNVRPAWPLKLISMVGALPAVVLEATIEVGLVIDGRALCSVIVPPAIDGSKVMVFGLPGEAGVGGADGCPQGAGAAVVEVGYRETRHIHPR